MDAYIDAKTAMPVEFCDDLPVEASVIIPVRNRAATIGDAVKSALVQNTAFRYNIIVVDNRSTDGTTGILARLSAEEPKLIHIIPDIEGLGIGGCWNMALMSEHCGRFAVQLDSDDLYESPDTLQAIVDKFYEQRCAMVVGAYTLTDINKNVMAPGLISHNEWTDGNGRNNALRINGFGAPRAFYTPIARELLFPDTSYGEDYAMACTYASRTVVHDRHGCTVDIQLLYRDTGKSLVTGRRLRPNVKWCGASAPDHSHFQGVPEEYMPLDRKHAFRCIYMVERHRVRRNQPPKSR